MCVNMYIYLQSWPLVKCDVVELSDSQNTVGSGPAVLGSHAGHCRKAGVFSSLTLDKRVESPGG